MTTAVVWRVPRSPESALGRKQTQRPQKSAVLQPRRYAPLGTALHEPNGTAILHLLSRPRRPHRSGEWTSDRAVTFIVTLAATRSVTLAAREARMSRKWAYALKSRDCVFAAAWSQALKAAPKRSAQGNKVEKVHGPAVSSSPGNKPLSRPDRERALAGLVARLRGSPALADPIPAQ